MTQFLSLVQAELIKLRRTPVLALVIIAPYVVTLFFFLFALHDGQRFLRTGDAWNWLATSSTTFWSLIIFPMWSAIVTAQIAAIEHRSDGFKHLFSIPVPRLKIYFAKQISVWLLGGTAHLGLVVAIFLSGMGLRFLRPGLGFEASFPLTEVGAVAILAFFASLFLLAVHTWLALLRTDLATPIVTGLLATISALALRSFDADLTAFHPWAYPSELVASSVQGELELVWSAVGLTAGMLFALLAGRSLVSRDVF